MKRLQNVWENLKTSFWFLPSIIVVISLTLAFVSLNLDQTFGSKLNRGFIKLFPGSAEAAENSKWKIDQMKNLQSHALFLDFRFSNLEPPEIRAMSGWIPPSNLGTPGTGFSSYLLK